METSTILILGIVLGLVLFVATAPKRKEFDEWYNDLLANPGDHVGDSLQISGQLVQQMGQCDFVFRAGTSYKEYYIELTEGARYQDVRQKDKVTISGRFVGLKHLSDGQGRSVMLPRLMVHYIQVNLRAEMLEKPERLLAPHNAPAA